MTDRKQIDLLVNASIRGQRELAQVPKTIAELEKALDKQTAAANRGESSIDELKATLLALQDVQANLRSKADLTSTFEKMGKSLGTTEERADKAAVKYKKLLDATNALGTVTEVQQEKLLKASQASQKANERLDSQRRQYEGVSAALREAGIDTNNLADAERQLNTSAAQLGLVMDRNRQAIAGYGEAVRKAREDERARASEALALSKKQSEAEAKRVTQQKALSAQATADAAAAAAQQADIQAKQVAQQKALFDKSEGKKRTQDDATAVFAAENALQAQADAADKAAAKYTTLARASDDLAPRITSVKAALAGITNPAAESLKSLGNLEKQSADLATAIGSITKPVEDYKKSQAQLNAIQGAAGKQGALIDSYREQVAALRASRAEFVAARTQVTQYAEGVRQGGSEATRFASLLAGAQGRLSAASSAMADQVVKTRGVQQALRDAGVATNDLASAESRLVAVSQQTTQSLKQLGDAASTYGVAVEKVAKGGGIGGPDGGRESLSFAQRLRGQILSLTAAYVGLFGAVQVAKNAIASEVGQQTIESRLAVAIDSNDTAKIGKEYEYLRGRAEYYGVGIQKLAESYGSYAISAKSANLTDQQTKYTFEQLSAGMRVMKLNTDQQSRAWAQFTQILSKAKPELEDIKTVAEAGFAGVQGLMARGLVSVGVAGVKAGTETADMFKLMKAGALDSKQAIFALAVQAEKEFGGRIPQAIKTLQAEQGRFETATFEFQKKIAESGWADAYRDTLVKLIELMNTQDGANAAKAASDLFSALARVLIIVLENIELVKTAAIGFLAVWGAGKFTAAVAGLGTLSAGILGVGAALTIVQKSQLVVAAAFAGWEFGSILAEKWDRAKVFGVQFAIAMVAGTTIIMGSYAALGDAIPILINNAFAKVVNSLTKHIRTVASLFAKFNRLVGLDSAAEALEKGIAATTMATQDLDAAMAGRRAKMKADLAAIKAIGLQQLADIKSPPVASAVTPAAVAAVTTTTGRPETPKNTLGADDKKAEAAAKRRLAQIEEITKALETLKAKTDRAQSDSLASQLAAVDEQFNALQRKIAALGGKEGQKFAKEFADGVGALKGQITENFNKKLLEEQTALQKKLEDVEVAAGKRSRGDLEARLGAVALKYANLYRDIEASRVKAQTNGGDGKEQAMQKARLDAGVLELQNLETQKFYKDEITRREQEITNLVQARSSQIKTVNDLEAAGLITSAQAREQIKIIVEQSQPAIEQLAISGQAFAASLSGAFDPAKLQQFIAMLQLATASAGGLQKSFELTGKQVEDMLVNGATQAFDKTGQAIANVVNGTQSLSDGIKSAGAAFANFAADFLKQIALMIIKQLILNQLQTGGGDGIGGFFSKLVNGAVKHDGGRVGGTNNRSRAVPAQWFANAPRYHAGGMPGLSSDEYATILQQGEEVLSKSDPRNMGNIVNSAVSAGAARSDGGVRVVVLDEKSKVPEAMASAQGEAVVLQIMRKHAASIRQIVR